jgi:hypothetical protein
VELVLSSDHGQRIGDTDEPIFNINQELGNTISNASDRISEKRCRLTLQLKNAGIRKPMNANSNNKVD